MGSLQDRALYISITKFSSKLRSKSLTFIRFLSEELGKAFYMPELHNHHGQTDPIWYGEPSFIEYKPVPDGDPAFNSIINPIQGPRKLTVEKDERPNQSQDRTIITEPATNPVKSLDECFYTKCDPFEEFKLFGKTDI